MIQITTNTSVERDKQISLNLFRLLRFELECARCFKVLQLVGAVLCVKFEFNVITKFELYSVELLSLISLFALDFVTSKFMVARASHFVASLSARSNCCC